MVRRRFGLSSAQRAVCPLAIKFKEPVASRVYQRDANGKADIPVVLDENLKPESFDVRISGVNMAGQGIKLVDGKLVGVPVGGPYTVNCSVEGGARPGNDDHVGWPGVRGRPLGAGGPVEHARSRRPDRRHAAQSRG